MLSTIKWLFPTPCIIENFTRYCGPVIAAITHGVLGAFSSPVRAPSCPSICTPQFFLVHTDSGQWWSKFCGHAGGETRNGDILVTVAENGRHLESFLQLFLRFIQGATWSGSSFLSQVMALADTPSPSPSKVIMLASSLVLPRRVG
jgi:hypothetical protein